MEPRKPDDRTAIAKGYDIAGRITGAGVTFALCAFAGNWLDGRLGSKPLIFLLGVMVGLFGFVYQLMAVVKSTKPEQRNDSAK